MKNIAKRLAHAALAILTVSCTETGDAPEAPARSGANGVTLRIGVSEMIMSEWSRAINPMSPDTEKYIKTLALFEFDNEGQHERSGTTYHFIDFEKGTVDDSLDVGIVKPAEFGVTETSLQGIDFEEYDNGTICAVANVTKKQVSECYLNNREEDQSYGVLYYEQFKEWALPFDYVENTKEGVYDETETGHIETVYMFGYYQGPIPPPPTEEGEISIDIGRLASRLDITFRNDTGHAITKRLGYHFDNVCVASYFFPITTRRPPVVERGTTRTVICSGVNYDGTVDELGDEVITPVAPTFEDGAEHTRYFYVAAHSAKDYSEATKLHLFYNQRVVDEDGSADEGVHIPMCNVHPSQAADVTNGYSLSRNTRYRFTIHLRNREEAPASIASRGLPADRPVVCADDLPGEYSVYLPAE